MSIVEDVICRARWFAARRVCRTSRNLSGNCRAGLGATWGEGVCSCTSAEAARNCDANYHKSGKKINGRARACTHTHTHIRAHTPTKKMKKKKKNGVCTFPYDGLTIDPFLFFFFLQSNIDGWYLLELQYLLVSLSLSAFFPFFFHFVSSFFFFCVQLFRRATFTQSNEAVKLKKRDCASCRTAF